MSYRRITSQELRKRARHPGEREPCYICQEHGKITQAHHICTLKAWATYATAFQIFEEPPTVWLCPNCHAYVHQSIKNVCRTLDSSIFNAEQLDRLREVVSANFLYPVERFRGEVDD